jgi:pteridine reductase
VSRKAVLITGGARRVGAAFSLYFAERGYDVALHYNSSKAEAVKIQRAIDKIGRKCELFACDLQKTKALPAMMKQVQKAMPHCTALINNASIFERAGFLDTDEALFDRQLNVNFKAPFFLTQAFARSFKKGCVVNVLDTDIAQTQGSHFAYLLSKKALAAFTPMAARALGPDIRVNGVCPGAVLPSSQLDKNYMEKLPNALPLKRLARLEEVAAAALSLCENEAITGQILYADSGQHLL